MRNSVKLLALASTLAILGGCSNAPQSDEAEAEGVGYVLMDLEARDAGYRLDGLESDALLPTELDAGEVMDLIGPEETVPIEVARDELVWVRGADGVIEHRAFDFDVSRDVLYVAGSERAAKTLAKQLNGIYEKEEDGLWRIQATDAYQAAADGYSPKGLDEVLPAVTPELADLEEMADGAAAAETRRQLLDAVPAKRLLSFEIADNLPIMDLLTPPVSCEDAVAGIWVSRAYFAEFDDWYIFTLEIRRDAEDTTQLTGRIRSRTWSGDVAIESPVACDMHPPSHIADAFDFTVAMQAQGSFHSGNVTFGGSSWKTTSMRCGPKNQWFGYNLDNFSGIVSEDGRWMDSLNNDGGRSVDDQHKFRRISCL
jgi:hypothetical protein